MGFRTNAWAKVWEVTPMTDVTTKMRISTRRKNKQTGVYEQDFSGFVMAVGTTAAHKAAGLYEGASIKIGDCDVTTKYDKEKKITYTNYSVFSFEVEEPGRASTEPQPTVDEGEFAEGNLPF